MIKYFYTFRDGLSIKNHIFLYNTFYNLIFVGLKLGLSLLLIPLLLNYIGEERFGIWQTILSIVSFMTVLNFGYANGLRNLITKLSINPSNNNIGKAIGATYIKVFKIVSILSILIIPTIYFFADPKLLFLKTPISSVEITYSLLIFISFFLLNIILSLSDSIAFGLQKSYLTSLFQTIYLLICYLLVYFIGKKIKLNLIHISFIFGSSQSISYFFFIIYQKIKFKINIDFRTTFSLKETNKLSFHFFLAHFLALIFLSIDNFIISLTLGAEETASYSVVNKIFFTLITLFSVLLIHFWNSVTDAYEKKEFEWILRTIKTLYVVSIGFFLIALIISFFQKGIISFWLGNNNLKLEPLTFYLFSIYVLLHCINAIFVNLQNGLGYLKIQIYTTVLVLLLYILGSYMVDIKLHGYNILIVIKITVMAISVGLNSLILRKIKK